MRTHHNLLISLLALFALVAAACGSETSLTARGPLPTLVPEAPLDVAATEAADSEAADSADADSADGADLESVSASTLQHGQTLDEWTANNAGGGDSALAPSAGFTTIAWDDLIPPGQSSQELYERFEDRLLEVEYGSEEATELYQEMEAAFDTEAVNEELDGQKIWLAGFVAPLTYEGEIVTEFLLVPNFGACIHVPPPPPNQTIMVTLDSDGLTTEESWGAVWVEGTLTLVSAETELAPASYTITGATTGVYTRS